jgi:Fe-S-cluster containining protein
MAGQSGSRVVRHARGRQGAQTRGTRAACEGCPALCCRDLVIRILKPRTRYEVEELKWHVQYDTVRVFIVGNRWHLQVRGKCMHLGPDNLCRIYGRRPDRCRRLNPPNCERYGEYYDVMLSTPDELEEYVRKRKRAR